MSEVSKPHQAPQGAHVRLAEADTADLFRIVRNLREPGWAREVALKRIEEQLEAEQKMHDVYRGELDDANRHIIELKEQLEAMREVLKRIIADTRKPPEPISYCVHMDTIAAAREVLASYPASEPQP